MPKVAFITASNMPKPDLETAGLVARLPALGCEAAQLTWDAEVDWSGYDLIVLRTPWDYVERLEEFLTWIRRVDETTKLLNPAATIEWNAHKRYLLELQASGVPVVATTRLTSSGPTKYCGLPCTVRRQRGGCQTCNQHRRDRRSPQYG